MLYMSRRGWRRLLADLSSRGGGERESGAFLLARSDQRGRRVVEWMPFDELDPRALNGAISIRGMAFSRLWAICDERQLRVIADIHTHPGTSVRQSAIDRANPMVARRGHVGIIVPDFAQGRPSTREIGVHVYLGDRAWASHFGRDASRLFRLRWW